MDICESLVSNKCKPKRTPHYLSVFQEKWKGKRSDAAVWQTPLNIRDRKSWIMTLETPRRGEPCYKRSTPQHGTSVDIKRKGKRSGAAVWQTPLITYIWLTNISMQKNLSDCMKPSAESKFLDQDFDAVFLANIGIVIGCFDQIPMETGKLLDNIGSRKIDSNLMLTGCLSCRIPVLRLFVRVPLWARVFFQIAFCRCRRAPGRSTGAIEMKHDIYPRYIGA